MLRSGAKAGTTVLGRFPDYLNLADKLNANRFDIPTEVWNRMTSEQQWAANQKFLDLRIQTGDEILLATPLDEVKPGSFFERELNYLFSRGYTLNEDGTRLIPPND
jgi:hypothetical protein